MTFCRYIIKNERALTEAESRNFRATADYFVEGTLLEFEKVVVRSSVAC